jgi:hypothetical protein
MARYQDPEGSRYGIPTYGWHTAPDGLATRRQLRALGLCPGRQPIAGQVRWRGVRRRGTCERVAYLYRIDLARPKRTPTPAQLAAVARATAARRTCRKCQTDYGHRLPEAWGGVCWLCDPDNEIRL